MKEFKFCGEMTEYVEIPVYVCETQKEMVNEISEVREVSFNDYIYEKVESIEFNRQCAIKERKEHGYSAWFYDEQIRSVIGTSDETSIYIIYKDGSKYFETFGERQGKFKRYGIKAAVIETAFEYTVYGDFAVTDNGDISIEESDIEEYGVYNGQYDVKEEPEAVVEAVETEEKAEEEIITMANTNASIAKAEEQKTQFDFYNVTIGFEVEKFIGTIHSDYESLGIYSDYEKAVQAAQEAADEYGAENIYFHTVEIATRNDREIYDREDYEFFVEERETIRHNWYTLMIVDTGKREYVNLDKPVRLDFKE